MTSSILDFAICALLAAAMLSIATYRYQRRTLTNLVRSVLEGTSNDRDRVFELARFVFSKITRNRDPIFILPLFQSLGGSPLAIFERGGCCSGIHRLFIASLETIGIRAAQVTLYHRSGKWCHCLVQVSIDGRPLLIDVDYGVYYEAHDGNPLGLTHLRDGIHPIIRVFAQGLAAPLCEGYLRIPTPGYPTNEYYDFDFTKSRTANWIRSWRRRSAHHVLTVLTRGSIDSLLLPPFLEWPQVTLAIIICSIAALLFIIRATVSI